MSTGQDTSHRFVIGQRVRASSVDMSRAEMTICSRVADVFWIGPDQNNSWPVSSHTEIQCSHGMMSGSRS